MKCSVAWRPPPMGTGPGTISRRRPHEVSFNGLVTGSEVYLLSTLTLYLRSKGPKGGFVSAQKIGGEVKRAF